MRNAIKYAEAEYFKLMKNNTGVMFQKKRPSISRDTTQNFSKKAATDDHSTKVTYAKETILGRKQIEKKALEELYNKFFRRHQIVT